MIKFEETEVRGFDAAIRGMRNPMESWEKSDSIISYVSYIDRENMEHILAGSYEQAIGKNDLDLMMKLAKAGPEHAKYRRMIGVWVDITAPLYWWKEFDTYKVGTVANSCSTMHYIHKKEFTLNDFSCEHLFDHNAVTLHYIENDFRIISNKQWLLFTCDLLNGMRKAYLETNDKKYWWQMIQLLPSSYNQKRTIFLNYEVLANIYRQRQGHKLDEWHEFIDWIKQLPYSQIITLEG